MCKQCIAGPLRSFGSGLGTRVKECGWIRHVYREPDSTQSRDMHTLHVHALALALGLSYNYMLHWPGLIVASLPPYFSLDSRPTPARSIVLRPFTLHAPPRLTISSRDACRRDPRCPAPTLLLIGCDVRTSRPMYKQYRAYKI